MEATVLPDFAHDLTFGFAGRYIRRKARQLVGRAGLTISDCPDLEQELALAVFQRLHRFNPQRAHWNVFLVTIVERHIVTILRARRRAKRGGRASQENDSEIGQFVESRQRLERTRQDAQGAFDEVDLRHDLDVAVAALPPDLRYVCFCLQFESVAEMSRRIRVSRTTLHRQIHRIRRAFVRIGLSGKKIRTVRAQTA